MIPIEIIKNRLGINTLPSFCTYIVTWRCNCRCKMCDIWKKEKEEELKLKEIVNIFKQQKFDAVRITGGEPFLREDLDQIVNTIQKYNRPKVCHITTNGILTNKILIFLKKLKETRNLHIKISIDAVGEKHDEIRGIRGAYLSALKTVQELSKVRKKYNFYLGINQVIVDENGLQNYWQLKKIFDEIKIPVHLVFAYKRVGLYHQKKDLNFLPKSNNEFPCFFEMPKDKIIELPVFFKKVVNSIPNFKERLIQRYYFNGLYNRLADKKGNPNPPCLALRSHLRILPNGDIPVCIANSTIVGNLRRKPLKNLWFSKEIKKYRQLVKKCRGCWYGCEAIPNAIYSGDIIKGLF